MDVPLALTYREVQQGLKGYLPAKGAIQSLYVMS
jgi:hypothetical protein